MNNRFKHALRHIELLGYGEGDRVLLRALPRDKTQSARNFEFIYPDIPEQEIRDFESDGYGIHLLINGANRDVDVEECRAIFYEHDDLDLELSKALWQSLGLPEPTLQVSTGGKSIHSYWSLLGAISPQLWRRLQSDLLEFSDADRALKNPSRTMRLAGTRHAGTGDYARIAGGCGKACDFDELRGIIPESKKSSAPVDGVVTWQQFITDFRFPISEPVPLEACLLRATRNLLQEGAKPGTRATTAYRVASDLQAAAAILTVEGQRFDGDPYNLFIDFCRRCPDAEGWNEKEWSSVWKQAQSQARKSFISPEAVENCVRGWAWQNCPGRVAPEVNTSAIAKTFPVGSVEVAPIDKDKTEEEKLREAITNYNTILDAGNLFQAIPYRNWIQQEFNVTRGDIEMLAKSLQRGDRDGLVGMCETMTELQQEILDRSLGTNLSGISCGFYDLDAMTQGFQRSDLIIAAGRPAMGKTSFVMNIARNISTYHQLPVAVFSLEMNRSQLAYRMLAGEAQIESGRLRSGRVAPTEWEPLGHAIVRLTEAQIYVDDTGGITVEEIWSKSRALQASKGLGMVIIDYLQLMDGSGDNRAYELSRITKQLKAIARELNVPVIALSQVNRGVEQRGNKRPTMSDLKDSGGIEQDADVVMLLYRDEYYNPDTPDRGVAEVIIAKHRNGPVGTVRLLFEPQFTRFKNLATPGAYTA